MVSTGVFNRGEAKSFLKYLSSMAVFFLLLSVCFSAVFAGSPQISISSPGDVDSFTTDDYVNVSVNVTSDVNCSSFINWNNSLCGYWNFEHHDANDIFDNSTNDINLSKRYKLNDNIAMGIIDNITESGKFGNGLQFNSSDWNFYAGSSTIPDSLNITGELTVEAWIKEHENSFNNTYYNKSDAKRDGSCCWVNKTSDGGFIATGYLKDETGDKDLWLVKINEMGNMQWNKTYGNNTFNQSGYCVKQTSDGGYIVVGYCESNGKDVFVVKTDSNGTYDWSKTYGGDGNDNGKYIIENNVGNYSIVGYENSWNGPLFNLWFFEINDIGDHEINETHNISIGKPGMDGGERGQYVEHTSDGGYIITGYTNSYHPEGGDKKEIWLVKIEENETTGYFEVNESCNMTYGGGGIDEGNSLVSTPEGYIIVGGIESNDIVGVNVEGGKDMWLIHTDKNGNEIENETFDVFSGYDEAFSIYPTYDGNYIVAGLSNATGAQKRLHLIKIDVNLTEIWNKTIYNNATDASWCTVVQADDGGFIVGSDANFTGSNSMFWLAKTNSTGEITGFTNNQSCTKTIVGKGRDAYQLELNACRITARVNDSLTLTNLSLYSLTSQWHHIAFTFNGTNISLYVNGSLKDSNSSNTPNLNSNILTIARNFSGIIDEIRIWNRSLSPDEIARSYNCMGNYSQNFTSLADMNYSYYAYVIDEDGIENHTANYSVLTGITPPSPPSDFTVSTCNRTVVNLTWTKGQNADYTNITYDIDNYPSDRNSGIASYNNAGTSWNVTGLNFSTTYYFRAWSYNSTFNLYSETYTSVFNTTDSNTAPVLTTPCPSNDSTGESINPILSITVNDTDSDTMNVTFWTNATASWSEIGYNSSSPNGTYSQTPSNMNQFNNTYWWSVNVTDGYNWTNETYHFTTYTNYTSSQQSHSIYNSTYSYTWTLNSTNVTLTPQYISVSISDQNSDLMNLTIYHNDSGNWKIINQTSSGNVSNSTFYAYNTTWINQYNTSYNMSFNLTDGNSWSNQTFNFTTLNESVPNPPSSFTATKDGTSTVLLSWTKGNKADYTRIQRKTGSYPRSISDGTNVYNNTGNSKTDSSLSSNTKYYYRVWSWNNTYGFWSIFNVSDTATTDSSSNGGDTPPVIPDDTEETTDEAPTISNVSRTPTSVDNTQQVTISATVTDDLNLTTVKLYYNDGDGVQSKTMTTTGDGVYTATIGTFIAGTTVSYYIKATDNSSQTTQSSAQSFTVTQAPDTTAPTITIIKPLSGATIYDLQPVIKAEYTDVSGINTSSVQISLDGNLLSATTKTDYVKYMPLQDLSISEHTIDLTVEDNMGNQASKVWSFTIKQAENKNKSLVDNATSGKDTTKSYTDDIRTGLQSITIRTKTNLSNITIFTSTFNDSQKPDELTAPQKEQLQEYLNDTKPEIQNITQNITNSSVYKYFEITITVNDTDLEEESLQKALINFTINKTWLTENNVSKDTITVSRYYNNNWQFLNTTIIRETEEFIYLQAQTPGFSTFAVVGGNVVEKSQVAGVKNQNEPELPWTIIIGFIISTLIILIFILFKARYIYIEKETE